MKGRVFGETEGDMGWIYLLCWYVVGGCCSRETGGIAKLAQVCERPRNCQHSRRSTQDVENLENSTEKRARSGNSSFGWK
eukprot:12886553-Prorocentrum_lima.AAC.1